MEEEARPFIVSIPKIRIPAKKSVESLNPNQTGVCKIRKPSEVSLKKYSLPGDKPLKVKKLQNELLLLPYRLFSKRQESERHKTRLSIHIKEKYKIGYTDLRKRLYVEGPTSDIRGLTDIDRKFFKSVDGRPFKHGVPLFKSLKPLLNTVFRMRYEVSTRNDCILRIESNMRKEAETYKATVKKCKDQANNFDKFISEDYLRSMAFLNEWEDLKKKLDAKVTELQNLANDKFTIISRLIGLDYRYSVQQKYGRFLYYLSPPTWRLSHRDFARSIEIEKKGFDLGNTSDEDPFVVIFEKLQHEILRNPISPVLYFERPQDLMHLLESSEQQQLHYLAHVTYSTPYTKVLKQKLNTLKTLIQQSSYSVVKSIKDFEVNLEDCFTRCNYLEDKFHRIINGMFYDSVGALDVLKMNLHLEYCYEKVIGEKPMNLNITAMAKTLESCYMDYSQLLDEIHCGDIKEAIKYQIELEKCKMKTAKLAARELRLFNRLEKELLRTCLPLSDFNSDLLPPAGTSVKRSLPTRYSKAKRMSSRAVVENTRASLTEAEEEFLALFTDWTETEDPADYLQSLAMRKQSNLGNET